MVTTHSINTIVSDPNIRNGQPIVAGTGIRVVDLVTSHLYRGLNPDEVAAAYALTLGQVYAALAYYYDHKREIDDWMRADAEAVQELLAELERQGKLTRID